MKKIALLLIPFLALACSQQKSEKSNIIQGLATPFLLQGDTSLFYLSDYVLDFKAVDSVVFPEKLKVSRVNDSVFKLIKPSKYASLASVSVFQSGNSENILIINREKQKIVIKHKYTGKYKNLKVIGNMNNWNRGNKGMTLIGGEWQQEFMVSPGVYEYLFYSEGYEFSDPENPLKMGNNSVLQVGKFLPEDLPFITEESYSEKSIRLSANQDITKWFVLWQNKLITPSVSGNQIELQIPDEASQEKRSFIRVHAYNENGISNDVFIPLEYGKVVESTSQLDRSDKQTMIMYFLMVDRFCNGDSSNDEPVADPEILPKANYFGGDLAGIKKKIDEGYFNDLGVNTIWLSPIVQNPKGAYGLFKNPRTKFSGYHGYWPVSNTKIDYRFGTDNDLKGIISATHENDMNFLLDYVANHVHQEHPVYKEHPDWATSLYLPDGTMNTEKWDEHRLTTWFDTFLPTLDLRRKDVVDAMVDSAVYWYTKFGIDGFRHDATKHIDELYWRTLTKKLKELRGDKPFYQIGETYGSPILISSYIGSGMLDAQFDFNTYDNAIACFALDNENFGRLKSVLGDSWKYYGYHNLMGNITGNQDRARFISYAGGEVSFNEDAKVAGWIRNIGVGDTASYEKLKMLQAFNMTIPGIPVIYYGDEYGMPGGNDPDNRRQMKFEYLTPHELDVKKTVEKLIDIRKNSMPLLYGQTRILQADNNIFAYLRVYFDKKVLVILNKSREQQDLNFDVDSSTEPLAEFGSSVTFENSKLNVSLKPVSFEIINFK
ncbi:MAG: alpha-glucosidase C-terminal domain-containing protein [Bacteroidales bacterium]|nr:alpha-glucosidase C-terminal domain-containing protein [Bacteroidales bacterium]MBN2818013.1 alpha-glucosidase C-terminal domain-containing protein [Bacteroidales bacterium]